MYFNLNIKNKYYLENIFHMLVEYLKRWNKINVFMTYEILKFTAHMLFSGTVRQFIASFTIL